MPWHPAARPPMPDPGLCLGLSPLSRCPLSGGSHAPAQNWAVLAKKDAFWHCELLLFCTEWLLWPRVLKHSPHSLACATGTRADGGHDELGRAPGPWGPGGAPNLAVHKCRRPALGGWGLPRPRGRCRAGGVEAVWAPPPRAIPPQFTGCPAPHLTFHPASATYCLLSQAEKHRSHL